MSPLRRSEGALPCPSPCCLEVAGTFDFCRQGAERQRGREAERQRGRAAEGAEGAENESNLCRVCSLAALRKTARLHARCWRREAALWVRTRGALWHSNGALPGLPQLRRNWAILRCSVSAARSLSFAEGRLCFPPGLINSYFASVAAGVGVGVGAGSVFWVQVPAMICFKAALSCTASS